MKKILAIVLMLCMLLACTAVAEDVTIGYICANLTNQGWLIMNQTVQSTAKEKGVDLKYMTAQMGDTASWLACFEDLRNMNVDAILFGAADATLVSTIEAAVADGMLCIEMDSPSGAKGTNVICIENYAAAAQGAEWVGEYLGGNGQVILINGDATYTSGVERRNGYYETLQEKYPDIEIFEVWCEGWTDENAMNGAEDALTALNEDVDAIICCWDGATIVVSSILESRGLSDQVSLIGFDGAGDALTLMREGKIAMDVAQPFADLARNAVDVAVRVTNGEAMDAVVLDAKIVTPENLEEYIVEGGMTEFVK